MNPVQVSLDAVTRCKGRADQSVDTPVMVRAEQKSPGQAEHREDRAELDSNEQGEVQAEQTEKNLESKFERSKKWKDIETEINQEIYPYNGYWTSVWNILARKEVPQDLKHQHRLQGNVVPPNKMKMKMEMDLTN